MPNVALGNAPKDDGGLIFSSEEYEKAIKQNPAISKFIKKFIGADEFINSYYRYCLWIKDNDLKEANEIPEIKNRLEQVKRFRLSSPKVPTQKLAQFPNRFGEIRYFESDSIIIPAVTSEKRNYLPVGFLDKNWVISNSSFAIYNAEAWLFALLSSTMHMVWIKSVAGRLE